MSARRRQLLLNFAMACATIVLLGLIVFAAQATAASRTMRTASGPGGSTGTSPPLSPCPQGRKYPGSYKQPLGLGYVIDAWHINEFQQKMEPYKVAFFGEFMNWGESTDPTQAVTESPWKWFVESKKQDVTPYFTWDPWAGASTFTDGVEPSVWSNQAIASGSMDKYILMWARAAKRYGKTVYVRLAQEMNGPWYPWSQGPSEYIAMWRHVVDLFRKVGATNVRFVWAPNMSEAVTQADWCASIMSYWPGGSYVSDVGATTIDFGASETRPLSIGVVSERINALRGLGKPIDLSEVNSAWGVRISWFKALAGYLKKAPWVRNVIISQAPSHFTNTAGAAGNLNWDMLKDPATLRIVKTILKERQGKQAKHR